MEFVWLCILQPTMFALVGYLVGYNVARRNEEDKDYWLNSYKIELDALYKERDHLALQLKRTLSLTKKKKKKAP